MAVLSVDNPGAWNDAETADMLHPADARRVRNALNTSTPPSYREEPLWQRYDGACDPAYFSPTDVTWWIRYFDYI